MLFYVNPQCCTWPVAFVTDSEETVKAIVLKLVKCCYSNHLCLSSEVTEFCGF